MHTINLKPKWKIELLEQKGAHFYAIDGQNLMLPSSTTVLGRVYQKPILIPWAAKQCGLYLDNYLAKIGKTITAENKDKWLKKLSTQKYRDRIIRRMKRQYKYERDKAADKGTRAHRHFDDLFTYGEPQTNPDDDIKTAIENYHGWHEKTSLRIIQGDTKVASLKFGFAGSLDGIAINDQGGLEIIDYKTSNFTGKDYAYQVASYAVAAQETFDLPSLPDTRVIRFDRRKKEWEERRVVSTQSAFEGFLLCLKLYRQLDIEHFELICSNHNAQANETIHRPKRKRRIRK